MHSMLLRTPAAANNSLPSPHSTPRKKSNEQLLLSYSAPFEFWRNQYLLAPTYRCIIDQASPGGDIWRNSYPTPHHQSIDARSHRFNVPILGNRYGSVYRITVGSNLAPEVWDRGFYHCTIVFPMHFIHNIRGWVSIIYSFNTLSSMEILYLCFL